LPQFFGFHNQQREMGVEEQYPNALLFIESQIRLDSSTGRKCHLIGILKECVYAQKGSFEHQNVRKDDSLVKILYIAVRDLWESL
jgi:hypothetical protein